MMRLSPDGRWIAFVTDESGRSEVVVQPFPGPGARIQVSVTGGTERSGRGMGGACSIGATGC
jgi:eukaryotic-like serine/threonine-protein kinase